MNKKTQRIIAIIIGLVLSGLLVYIGVRIVQRRATQASVPENVDCKRTTKTEAQCTWTSKDDNIGRILYSTIPAGGLADCNLVFISEESQPPISTGDSNYEHTVTFGPLVADEGYCVAVGGFEENIQEVAAQPQVPGAGGGTTGVNLQPPTEAPLPTVNIPTEEPAATEAPDPTIAPEKEAATDEEIQSYYEDTSNSNYQTCLEHFSSLGKEIRAWDCIQNYPAE